MVDSLFAPWRFDYVTSADRTTGDGCVFCRAFAAENDLPIPGTLELADRADAERAARELDFPCLLKPRTRTKEWDQNTRLKVFKIETPQKLTIFPCLDNERSINIEGRR